MNLLYELMGHFRFILKIQFRNFLKVVVFIIPVFISSEMPGQIFTVNFEQYTVKENLSANNARRLFQDSFGFIWVGTGNGLNRFDGRNFKVFRNDPADSLSISDSFITSIAEDYQGNLWVGTTNGLNMFDRQTETFIRVFSRDSTFLTTNQSITSVFVDKNNMIWVGITGMGLVKLDSMGKHQITYAHDPENNRSITQNNVLTIKEGGNGKLLLGLGGGGLSILEKETGLFQNFYFGTDLYDATFRANVIRDIIEDETGNLWLASYKGLHFFNPESYSYEYFSVENTNSALTENSIHKLVADEKNGFWLATFGGGLLYFDIAKKSFHQLVNPALIQTGEKSFFELLKTGDILWAGTSTNGLMKMEFPPSYFQHLTAANWNLQGNISPSAYVWGKNNEIWVAFRENGLHIFKPPNHLHPKPQILPTRDRINSIIGRQNINGLAFDDQGKLWLATARNGLFRIDTTTYNAEHFTYGVGENFISHMSVNALAKDPDGNMWIGTAFGLNKWNKSTNSITQYRLDNEGAFMPRSNNISSLHADKQNRLWIVTSNELLLYHKNDFSSVNLTNSAGKTYNPLMIFQQDEHHFFVGTTSGLIRLKYIDENTFEIEDFSHIENMDKLRITSIFESENGLIWLTTQQGLFLLDSEHSALKYFRSGLPLESPGLSMISKTPDGLRLIMTGHSSLLMFDLLQADLASDTINAFPENVRINNQPLKNRITPNNKNNPLITLPPGNHIISLDLIALEYYNPASVNFQYRILGLSPQWIDLGNQSNVSLVGLASGKYEFQMRAFLYDNQASPIKKLEFQINTPYWRTWWFVLLIGITILALVRFIYKYNLNRKLEVEKLRNKIARDLHDDIGATLTKISIFAELEISQRGISHSEGYLSRISNLGRDAVLSLGEVVWAIDARNDNLGNLFNKIQDYALDILPGKDIIFDFQAENIDSSHTLSAQVRQNLYLICKEAINNMVKHSNGNRLKITFNKTGKALIVEISDNGSVNSQTLETARGNGLSNIKSRVAALRGKVKINTNNGFTILITEINL
jgi:ligand-binding sensor domain-containing protein/signal transduction histidine kinase